MSVVRVWLFILFGGLLTATVSGQNNNLREKFSWKQLDFAWSSDDARQEALSNGNYIPNNNLLLAFDIWQNKIFVTVPRCFRLFFRILFFRFFLSLPSNYLWVSYKTINYSYILFREGGGMALWAHWITSMSPMKNQLPSYIRFLLGRWTR